MNPVPPFSYLAPPTNLSHYLLSYTAISLLFEANRTESSELWWIHVFSASALSANGWKWPYFSQVSLSSTNNNYINNIKHNNNHLINESNNLQCYCHIFYREGIDKYLLEYIK